jgi:hypothetical protein
MAGEGGRRKDIVFKHNHHKERAHLVSFPPYLSSTAHTGSPSIPSIQSIIVHIHQLFQNSCEQAQAMPP